MSKQFNALITVDYDLSILSAIKPEEYENKRIKFTVENVKDKLIFRIDATDGVAFKSALTTLSKSLGMWQELQNGRNTKEN